MNKKLLHSTSIVSGLTLLSRTLGFSRDILLAGLFGATAGFDAFLVAFKIPNFMRALFAEGSFSQAFVPILLHYREDNTPRATLDFIARTMSWLTSVLLVLTLLFEIMAPLIVLIFAPGFLHDPIRYRMATDMLYITIPYVLLISITAYFGAVLNCYGHFFAPSFTPILLNVILILAGCYFAPMLQIRETALAIGILAAGVIQCLFQIPFLLQQRLLSLPRWPFNDNQVKTVFKKLLPALFGVSVMQIGLLIDTFFASFLAEGSISWLYYADRVTFFSVGIFGVALATVILPVLSSFHILQNKTQFNASLDWSLRLLLLVSIPATLGLVICSGPIVVTLFGHGKFDYHDMVMTQEAIMAFSLGLPGFMGVKILASAFYAKQELRKPVRIAMVATLSHILLSFILLSPLAHVGLAIATSVSSIINISLLYWVLVKNKMYQPVPGFNKFLVQLIFSNVMMSLILLRFMPHTAAWLQWQWAQQIETLLAWLAAAIFIYFCSLWLSGLRLQQLLGQPDLSA